MATKSKRGRPAVEDREWKFRSAGAQMIHESYRVEIADERAEGVAGRSRGTPTEVAYEMTAEHMGVSIDTARDAVLGRRRSRTAN